MKYEETLNLFPWVPAVCEIPIDMNHVGYVMPRQLYGRTMGSIHWALGKYRKQTLATLPISTVIPNVSYRIKSGVYAREKIENWKIRFVNSHTQLVQEAGCWKRAKNWIPSMSFLITEKDWSVHNDSVLAFGPWSETCNVQADPKNRVHCMSRLWNIVFGKVLKPYAIRRI